jgi:voltage-dependent calcium channel T type alpha-1G
MIIKLIALGCVGYANDSFNLFDAFIVLMSYVEIAMPGDSGGLTVLRAFRLMRVFKIIKSWKIL